MIKKINKSQARETALKILYKQEFYKESQNNTKELMSLSQIAQNYVNHLLQGVKTHREKIDEQIKQSSLSWTMDRMSLIDLNIMRIAVYEMLYAKPPTPFKVCIDESVEMAKTYGTEDSYKFVNGNLNTISKTLKP